VRYLIGSIVYVSIPFILVFIQPDFGSAIIYIAIWAVLVFTSGISKKHLAVLFGTALLLFLGAWLFVLKPYQKARIMNFVTPTADVNKSGYNARQSMIAVGSGQVIGKGIGYGTQSHLKFLPEYKTDFIFAAFSEEWGFIGSCIVIICYGIIFMRILSHAERGGSNFEILYALGLLGFLFVHTIINIGMNIGIMPVTGIALPFASYGGSHLLTEFLGLGLLFSMSSRSRRAHPDQLRGEYQGIGTDW
jgi:rod shape determining protein RodA